MGTLEGLALAVGGYFLVRSVWRSRIETSIRKKMQVSRHPLWLWSGIDDPTHGLTLLPHGEALIDFATMQLVVKTTMSGLLDRVTEEERRAEPNLPTEKGPELAEKWLCGYGVRRLDGPRWEVHFREGAAWLPLAEEHVPRVEAAYQVFVHSYVPLNDAEQEYAERNPRFTARFVKWGKNEKGKGDWVETEGVPAEVASVYLARLRRAGLLPETPAR
jgi:hypothetical protein